MPGADPKPPGGTGFGSFIPTLPNWGPLAAVAPEFKWIVGLGLAIMVLAGVIGIIAGAIRMSSGKQENVEAGMGRAKMGAVVMVLGFLLGIILIAVAAALSTLAKL